MPYSLNYYNFFSNFSYVLKHLVLPFQESLGYSYLLTFTYDFLPTFYYESSKNEKKLKELCSKQTLINTLLQFSSVQFSHSVVSNSLWPQRLQHTRPPCPSATPGAYSNSCPLSWWCHPTISSSVIPFSSHLQPFPASRSFPTSQFFASGSQSIVFSASTSVLPMNTQDWFPLGWLAGSPCSLRDYTLLRFYNKFLLYCFVK